LYIKEVELKNFKSFGKSIRVPLKNDFVTITGPNGSGKSNVVDALLFALCLSSSRAMRAERLPDLIYRGENGKNPDYAQVTVRLDNTSRLFPLDQDTIEVSRKIKVNHDKYASSYYFNGKACSQAELQDQLSKAGITPESYNIVMQGDVTRIIEMTPVERRKIVDEIAGVSEFDEKKKKAMDELDVVRERIARVDVILEIDPQGASQVKEQIPESVLVFITAPSLSELERRIRHRGAETDEQVRTRLETAQKELLLVGTYDHVVQNDDVALATERLAGIVESHRPCEGCR